MSKLRAVANPGLKRERFAAAMREIDKDDEAPVVPVAAPVATSGLREVGDGWHVVRFVHGRRRAMLMTVSRDISMSRVAWDALGLEDGEKVVVTVHLQKRLIGVRRAVLPDEQAEARCVTGRVNKRVSCGQLLQSFGLAGSVKLEGVGIKSDERGKPMLVGFVPIPDYSR